MKYYKRKSDMAWQKLGDHTLILGNLQNKSNHHLDEVGSFLWKLLEKKLTTRSLLDHTLNEYEIDRVTAKNDIEMFLVKLVELNLLEEIDD